MTKKLLLIFFLKFKPLKLTSPRFYCVEMFPRLHRVDIPPRLHHVEMSLQLHRIKMSLQLHRFEILLWLHHVEILSRLHRVKIPPQLYYIEIFSRLYRIKMSHLCLLNSDLDFILDKKNLYINGWQFDLYFKLCLKKSIHKRLAYIKLAQT